MAQRRSGQRGVANFLTCGVLLLFGALGFAAGCSSGEGAELEPVESNSQEQIICDCPKATPCLSYTCNKTLCVPVPVKDGSVCEDKAGGFSGVCLDALCCPGCVVRTKGGGSVCAPKEGTESTQCGRSGEYCANCNADSCLTGVCSRKKACEPVPEGEACVNSSGACHNGSCCQGCIDEKDQCVAGGAVDACGVSSGKLVKCQSCGNGDVCDGAETCSEGSCKGGTPLQCDDGEVCTEDSCGPGGCVNKPRTGADCSDGDPCTTGDKCGSDGRCQRGTPIKCDDGVFCTDDSCQGGSCVSTPKSDTATCDDGNSCTTADKCTAGKCAGTSASGVDCNDNNPCSIDIQPDCTVAQCNNDTPAGTSVSCITDKCHEGGRCSATDTTCVPGPEIDCDDMNPCTEDSCDPATGCTHTNNPAADCSDGDPCTENDVCVKGSCGGKTKTCEALDACHEAGSCDPVTGACSDLRADDGTPCPGGTCEEGTCVLDPTGAGGEGGQAAGGAPTGAGGETTASGGAGTSTGEAGQAQQPTEPGEAGAGTREEPERPFVRKPEGCSCDVPGGGQNQRPALAVLALVAGVMLRRSRRGRLAA